MSPPRRERTEEPERVPGDRRPDEERPEEGAGSASAPDPDAPTDEVWEGDTLREPAPGD
jgi:hypothetical protein